jgi:L-aminoadipate-semialdehyde dehydrogenase
MSSTALDRVVARLQNLPSISLPTDYPRPPGGQRVVEAAHSAQLSEQTSLSLLKLALHSEDDEDEDESDQTRRPTAFHLLLAAFSVLLHRYTADTDLLIGSSSASSHDPLLLRLSIVPNDPFWAVVKRVQQVEADAEADTVPYEAILRALGKNMDDAAEASRPLFRVRFFDETDDKENFIRSTSLTTDLTVFVMRPPPASTRSSLAPRISLRIIYNSLLFTSARISYIVDQLSVFLRKTASNPLLPVGSVPLLTPGQRAKLPTPIADLNWCDWKGAIPDIFSRNALRWPDRPCVIQSLPSDSVASQEKRVYSYGAIRRAANTLSHHLLKGGIQREDVVMVYAHRSVDLVVAVMAVLKAGATFSVIGIYLCSELCEAFLYTI